MHKKLCKSTIMDKYNEQSIENDIMKHKEKTKCKFRGPSLSNLYMAFAEKLGYWVSNEHAFTLFTGKCSTTCDR